MFLAKREQKCYELATNPIRHDVAWPCISVVRSAAVFLSTYNEFDGNTGDVRLRLNKFRATSYFCYTK